jgi:hypothetical protein
VCSTRLGGRHWRGRIDPCGFVRVGPWGRAGPWAMVVVGEGLWLGLATAS